MAIYTHVRPRFQGTLGTTPIYIFWGVGSWAGCVLASKAIELDRERFRKLRGETETEFVRNLKCLVDFELRT
jgi:hypothetical protein